MTPLPPLAAVTPYYERPGLRIFNGDALDVLRTLPDESVNCCVTSPPYFGLRNYGVDGQVGMEKTPADYVARLVEIFGEVRRVLADDGSLFLNLGDSYCNAGSSRNGEGLDGIRRGGATGADGECGYKKRDLRHALREHGIKHKDLFGIPWLVAFALRADGWWLRQEIIWAKSNCMPESVTDRCTRSHEQIFHLTKSARYYYNAERIKEPCIYDVDGTGTAARKARQAEDAKSVPTAERAGIRPGGYKNSVNFAGKNNGNDKQRGHSRKHAGFNERWDLMEKEEQCTGMRNKRDVWTVAPAQFPEAHFATFPEKLIEPCILAGCPDGGTVLDPFFGAGTTGVVCQQQLVNCIGIELNADYCKLAVDRLAQPVLGFILAEGGAH